MSNFNCNTYSFQLPLFNFHEIRSSFFNKEETEFSKYLSTVESLLLPKEKRVLFSEPWTGRKGYSSFQILAVILLKMYRRCNTVREVLKILNNEPNYRFIIGFDSKVVSEASMSRKIKNLEGKINISTLHERLATAFYKDRLVCNLSIDSTPIDAYEKPVKAEKKKNLKKGRKVKGSIEEKEYKQRLEDKIKLTELVKYGDVNKYLQTLENRCTVTGKRNSKGNMDWRIGYKAHLAVDDNGIPVSYAVTGASVHDVRLAIPLMRMADRRCTYLYALMDSGYSSKEVKDFAYEMGKIPVIDFKADRNGKKPGMDPAKIERYKARTTVERSNSELKLCFLPDHLHSRGFKARLDIELAVLLLTMKRMRMVLFKEQNFRQRKVA